MPLVTVLALLPDDASSLGPAVAAAAADALGRAPRDIWVRLVPAAAAVAGDEAETVRDQSPVVTVTTRPQPDEVVERTLRAVTDAVADVLGVEPRRVWARWDPLAAGTVYADGTLA